MKKYKVEIKEVLSRIVEIEAEDEEDAKEKAEYAYEMEEIVLYADDFDYMEIEVKE